MKATALGGPQPVLFHQSLPSFSEPEWALHAGYDGVILDLQHGELGLAEITVKIHRGNVARKMGAGSVVDLVKMAQALGGLDGDSC